MEHNFNKISYMKKKEIKPALDAIKTIRMPLIENKELRNALINIHLFLLKEQKKLEMELQDLQTVHLAPYEKERNRIGELQQQLAAEKEPAKKQAIIDEINSFTELLAAINAFNKDQYDKLEEDVEIKPVSLDRFVEEYQKQDYEPSVVEALYPLFEVN